MRKIESTGTLCNYYNEIVHKVNQLTEMCGNTPEAIKLRDDIYDMFTVKFSEPLFYVLGLQEDLGCPLEVFIKLQEHPYIYTDRSGTIPIILVKSGLWWYVVYDSEYTDIKYPLTDYKKTWWLKKDKSE